MPAKTITFRGHKLRLLTDKCRSIGARYVCDCGAVVDRGGTCGNWNGPKALKPCEENRNA